MSERDKVRKTAQEAIALATALGAVAWVAAMAFGLVGGPW